MNEKPGRSLTLEQRRAARDRAKAEQAAREAEEDDRYAVAIGARRIWSEMVPADAPTTFAVARDADSPETVWFRATTTHPGHPARFRQIPVAIDGIEHHGEWLIRSVIATLWRAELSERKPEDDDE